MISRSYSQAGQDLFCDAMLGHKRNGSFLEIGSNNPIEINNTYALEKERGWRGLLVDNSPESMLACEKHRESAFLLTDATQPQDWIGALRTAEEINHGESSMAPKIIDYLSLDIDAGTLDCLRNLPLDRVKFKVITIEHDAYRNGRGPRDDMLAILRSHGYDVLCEDVCDQGLPFEIWAVNPDLINVDAVAKFRRKQPTDWREILSLS